MHGAYHLVHGTQMMSNEITWRYDLSQAANRGPVIGALHDIPSVPDGTAQTHLRSTSGIRGTKLFTLDHREIHKTRDGMK